MIFPVFIPLADLSRLTWKQVILASLTTLLCFYVFVTLVVWTSDIQLGGRKTLTGVLASQWEFVKKLRIAHPATPVALEPQRVRLPSDRELKPSDWLVLDTGVPAALDDVVSVHAKSVIPDGLAVMSFVGFNSNVNLKLVNISQEAVYFGKLKFAVQVWGTNSYAATIFEEK